MRMNGPMLRKVTVRKGSIRSKAIELSKMVGSSRVVLEQYNGTFLTATTNNLWMSSQNTFTALYIRDVE